MPQSPENPQSADEVAVVIRGYYQAYEDLVKVIVIDDIESINYGRDVGYEVNAWEPPPEIGEVSASKIRRGIE